MSAGIQTSSVNDKIPVIDLAVLRRPLRDADAKMRAVMLERLGEACSSCGVFYVENHGVPETILRRATEQFDAFFDLPPENRMEIVAPPGQACGYEPLEESSELNDSFHCVFGVEEFPELEALLNTGPNRWPSRPAGLEATVRETMSALHRLGVDVMAALALSLGLPPEHFDPMVGASHGSFRARRYPPQRDQQGRVGTDAHVDGLALAFIVQNDVPGLQSEVPGVGWTAIEPRPGMLVCQLGTLFSRWTNDRYVGNRHRVVNEDPARERRSLIYWFPINPDATITCLPTCCGTDDLPRYPPILYTDYIAEWVRSFADEV